MKFNSNRLRQVLAIAATCLLPTIAQAQEACGTYVVKEGDTLGSISMAAYGHLDYQTLFNANVEALRAGPSALAVGTELAIPCVDGRAVRMRTWRRSRWQRPGVRRRKAQAAIAAASSSSQAATGIRSRMRA